MKRFVTIIAQPFQAAMRLFGRTEAKKAKKGVRCPECTEFLIVAIDGVLPKPIVLPKFCPCCGVTIHRRCPNCEVAFKKLDRFCSNCGKKVYEQASKSGLGQKYRSGEVARLLKLLRRDAEDMGRLIREQLLVVVRLNRVNQAVHKFFEIVEPVTEETEHKEAASLYEKGLEEAKFIVDADALEDTRDTLSNIVTALVSATHDDFRKVFPKWRTSISHDWIERPSENAEAIIERFMNAIASQYSDVPSIQQKYEQLSTLFPRYKTILMKSGNWGHVGNILNNVAAYLPEQYYLFGKAGAGVFTALDWWRSRSDGEFLKSFDAAVEEFIQSGMSFTQKIEEAITPVVEQFVAEFRELCDTVHDGLERASSKGIPIGPIYHALHYPKHPITDEDAKLAMEITLSNLKEHGLSLQSEKNLREMCGLNGSNFAS